MSVDLTGIAVSLIGAVFAIVGPLFLAWLRAHMQDQQAAATLGNAVSNALGALQQAAQAGVAARFPRPVQLPGVSSEMVPGVQYVLDHAGEEAARFGITPAAIAGKLAARVGLAAIQTNIATAASPAPTPLPLDPVRPTPTPPYPARPPVGSAP
jgi:hypothetical protein